MIKKSYYLSLSLLVSFSPAFLKASDSVEAAVTRKTPQEWFQAIQAQDWATLYTLTPADEIDKMVFFGGNTLLVEALKKGALTSYTFVLLCNRGGADPQISNEQGENALSLIATMENSHPLLYNTAQGMYRSEMEKYKGK
jgi:hypothetical protein